MKSLENIAQAWEAMPAHVPVVWLLLLMPLLTLLVWHHYQHLSWRHYLDRPSQRAFWEVWKAAKRRSLLIAAVWVIAVGIVIGMDLRYYRQQGGKNEASELSKEEEQPDKTETPATPGPRDPGEQENALDALKERYEDIFVSFFYLSRCGHAKQEDLGFIDRSLIEELQLIPADIAWRETIYNAAQGSYETVYADTPCDRKLLDQPAAEYDRMLAELKKAKN